MDEKNSELMNYVTKNSNLKKYISDLKDQIDSL